MSARTTQKRFRSITKHIRQDRRRVSSVFTADRSMQGGLVPVCASAAGGLPAGQISSEQCALESKRGRGEHARVRGTRGRAGGTQQSAVAQKL